MPNSGRDGEDAAGSGTAGLRAYLRTGPGKAWTIGTAVAILIGLAGLGIRANSNNGTDTKNSRPGTTFASGATTTASTTERPTRQFLAELPASGQVPTTKKLVNAWGRTYHEGLTYYMKCCDPNENTLVYTLPPGYTTFHAVVGVADNSAQALDIRVVDGSNGTVFDRTIGPGQFTDTGNLSILGGPGQLTFVLMAGNPSAALSVYPATFVAGDPSVS